VVDWTRVFVEQATRARLMTKSKERCTASAAMAGARFVIVMRIKDSRARKSLGKFHVSRILEASILVRSQSFRRVRRSLSFLRAMRDAPEDKLN